MLERTREPWRPSSAWDAAAHQTGRFGAGSEPAGVTLEPLDHLNILNIAAREGRRAQLCDVLSKRFSAVLPEAGRVVFGEQATLVWSAPGQWLVLASDTDPLDDLRQGLESIASVTDQGDGRALVRVGGPAARQTLAKAIAIDLHPDVFTAGCAATTAMAHVSVQLWTEADATTFLLLAPRTMAGCIWRWLTVSSAEFGYTVLR